MHLRRGVRGDPVRRRAPSNPEATSASTQADACAQAAADAQAGGDAPSAYDRVRNARSVKRPTALTLHRQGVRRARSSCTATSRFADDGAVVGGIARLGSQVVTVIGTERGTSTKDRVARNFGSAHPEGYRKALRLMQQAEKFGRPVICLIDTSGAYCGIEGGGARPGPGPSPRTSPRWPALAVPIVGIVIGEGGSGGALGLGMGNRVWMLENAVYSVISAEGCASILYKDSAKAAEAAQALGLTAARACCAWASSTASWRSTTATWTPLPPTLRMAYPTRSASSGA